VGLAIATLAGVVSGLTLGLWPISRMRCPDNRVLARFQVWRCSRSPAAPGIGPERGSLSLHTDDWPILLNTIDAYGVSIQSSLRLRRATG